MSLLALLVLAALAIEVRVSLMLAGFTMGLVVAAIGEPRRLARQLFGLTEGLFSPVFFVWLGASLNLRELSGNPAMVGLGVLLGLGAIAAHAVNALLRQPWPYAVLAAAQLGVPIAAVALGTQFDVLEPGEGAALLLAALITIAAVTLAGRAAADAAPPAVEPTANG